MICNATCNLPSGFGTAVAANQLCQTCSGVVLISNQSCASYCPYPWAVSSTECGTCAQLSFAGYLIERVNQSCVAATGCNAINGIMCELAGNITFCPYIRNNVCYNTTTGYPYSYNPGTFTYIDTNCTMISAQSGVTLFQDATFVCKTTCTPAIFVLVAGAMVCQATCSLPNGYGTPVSGN
jgi:hypothetical protein